MNDQVGVEAPRTVGIRTIAADVLEAGIVAPPVVRDYLEGPLTNPAVVDGMVEFVREGIEILCIPYADRAASLIAAGDVFALVCWCHRNGADIGADSVVRAHAGGGAS